MKTIMHTMGVVNSDTSFIESKAGQRFVESLCKNVTKNAAHDQFMRLVLAQDEPLQELLLNMLEINP